MRTRAPIGYLTLALFQGGLLTVLGLFAGILYAFGGLVIDALVSAGWITCAETPGLGFGTVLAFLALIGMPLVFGGFGFVAGLIEAGLYNVCVRWIGGRRKPS